MTAPGERLWLGVSKSIGTLENAGNELRPELCPKVGSLFGQSDMQVPLTPCASSEGETGLAADACKIRRRSTRPCAARDALSPWPQRLRRALKA